MSKPLDAGVVVICVHDEVTYGVLKKGRHYKIESVLWHGFGVFLQGLPGPYSRERFALKYEFDETDPNPEDEGLYDADH